uniref:Uncharacterized protein n=1 Tax=Arundo donax TaxID=35708 RepID=A0A0A9A658_ARUDO
MFILFINVATFLFCF